MRWSKHRSSGPPSGRTLAAVAKKAVSTVAGASKSTPAKPAAVAHGAVKATPVKADARPRPAPTKAAAKVRRRRQGRKARRQSGGHEGPRQDPAVKAAPVKAATKAPAKAARQSSGQDGDQQAPAKAAPAKGTAARRGKGPFELPPVREGEAPWTTAELAELRTELEEQARELRGEIDDAEVAWHELQRDSGDGAGDDQADAGTKTFEREHELSLANNSRDLLAQVDRALCRLDNGTYGVCENCGEPVGKARLQAFPRATLCVTCKQREERR